MRTRTGHDRLELAKFLRPAATSPEPKHAPPNTLGYVASCSRWKTSRTSLPACKPTGVGFVEFELWQP
jgi:hypothetical protein